MNLAPLGWLAFIGACAIFVILALASASFDLQNAALADWGWGLIAFGLAFSGWWGARTPQ